LLHFYFLAVLVFDTLFPGDVQFGRTASHQHFLKVPHCEHKSTCQLFLELISLFWWAVCAVLYVLKLLSVASEMGGILPTETATFVSFET
jgi:hypothetical protein